MESEDSGISNLRHTKYSGIGEIRIQSEERYGNDGRTSQRRHHKDNKPCFKLNKKSAD